MLMDSLFLVFVCTRSSERVDGFFLRLRSFSSFFALLMVSGEKGPERGSIAKV